MSRFDCYRLETTGKRGTRVEDQVPNTVAWKPDAQMFDRREGWTIPIWPIHIAYVHWNITLHPSNMYDYGVSSITKYLRRQKP